MSKALRFLAGLSAVIVPAAISIYAYSKYNDDTKGSELESKKNKKASVTILYGTTTNTAKDYAERLCKRINANPLLQSNYNAQALNLAEYNHEDKFHKEDIVFIICSTWTDGTAPESCREFFTWLEDFAYDFRVSKDHLSNLRFAIFGLGSAYYDVDYCKHLYKAHEQMVELSAKPLEDVRRGDDQTDLDNKFDKWEREIMAILRHLSPVQETEMETGTGTGGKIVNKGGNSKVKVASTSSIKKSKTGPKGSDSRGNAFQRQQAVANGTYIPPIVEDDSSDDETSRDAAKANAQSGGANEDVEEEEEDRLNNMFVTMDHVDEADSKRIMSTMSSSTAAVTATDGSENLLPPEAEYDDSDSDSDAEDKDNKSGEKHKTAQTGLQDEVVDMEDLHKGKKNSSDGDTTADAGGSSCGSGGGCGSSEEKVSSKKEPLEMVTKLQRKALTKEGYRIIGTHSAVKLCRWTKNQMRGRGGCYKHTFYGITSYQCMEATPSLACANKCVFCKYSTFFTVCLSFRMFYVYD
jgi:tRNA wybutosine-synthesizing protein 1